MSLLRSWCDRRFFALAAVPGFLLLIAVIGVPLVAAIFLSFTYVVPGTFSFHWIGLTNYRSIFDFAGFNNLGVDFVNTYIFVGISLAIEVVVGVLIAVLLARRMRGVGLFRAIYALPLLVATIGSAVAWSALFNPTSGWVDYFLGLVGLGKPIWLADPHTAMLSVVIADAWSGISIVAFIVLAGLLSLPTDPVEAAQVDGSSALQTLRYITIPALRPVLAFAILYRMLGLFQQFALFQVMTGGGPGSATQTFSQVLHSGVGEPGYSGALAVVLVLMMAVPLLVLLRLASPRGDRARRRLPRPRILALPIATLERDGRRRRQHRGRIRLRELAPRSAKSRHLAISALSAVVLVVGALFVLLPLLWILVTAFQSPADAFQLPPHFIFRPTPSNFAALYGSQDAVAVPFLQDIGHSAIVLVTSVAIALGLGVPAGYALARSRFRGSRAITTGLVAIYVTPAILYIIPLYFIYTRLHVIYTYPSLVLFYETFELPLTIFFMRSYFAEVPRELEEAARVDGCTRWQAFRRVMLPMVRPGLATVAMLVAISSWGEYFGATIFTTTTIQTAPVAIETYVSYGSANLSVLAAATLVLIAPVLVLTIFLLRGFTRRFTSISIG
ncbi:MAG: transporter permease [Acidimicrobiaceae bacterium]|nr:transporter permease [Acidimicrobiaceae bacterium]